MWRPFDAAILAGKSAELLAACSAWELSNGLLTEADVVDDVLEAARQQTTDTEAVMSCSYAGRLLPRSGPE